MIANGLFHARLIVSIALCYCCLFLLYCNKKKPYNRLTNVQLHGFKIVNSNCRLFCLEEP